METLTESNFLLYAAKHYNSKCFDTSEFLEDLNNIKLIRKQFKRYYEGKDIKVRQVLNNIITLYNVFDAEHAVRMLWIKLSDYKEYLKPFLVYLNLMPDVLLYVDIEPIESSRINMDMEIIKLLRELK